MKSLVRLVVESRLTLDLADEPPICGDDVIKHDEGIYLLLQKADAETVNLIMEVIREMTEESRGVDDEVRACTLEDLPSCWGLAPSEDDLEFYDPEDPEENPALRPKLENPLNLLVEVLVEIVLFYWRFRVEPEFSHKQFSRISYHLKQEHTATLQAFLVSIRTRAEQVSVPDFLEYKEALLSIPYNLGLAHDPR